MQTRLQRGDGLLELRQFPSVQVADLLQPPQELLLCLSRLVGGDLGPG